MSNEKIKKLILVVVLSLTVAATWLYANPRDIATDSGFDTSYDSGSSYSGSSSSSYGSSSSNYSSSSYGSSSSHDYSKWKDKNRNDSSESSNLSFWESELLMFIWTSLLSSVIFALWLLISPGTRNELLADIKRRKERKEQRKEQRKKQQERENSINIMFQKYVKEESKKVFIFKRYQDYIDIQNAWMNFDYDTLKAKTTNELYNQYQMQLETLKVKGQKNVMNDFKYIDGKIQSIIKRNNKIIVTVEIVTKFHDYIIEESTNKVVRGNTRKKVKMFYKMKFVRDINVDQITHCPNCGAEVKNAATAECEFCKTIITKGSEEWLLVEKECLSQL